LKKTKKEDSRIVDCDLPEQWAALSRRPTSRNKAQLYNFLRTYFIKNSWEKTSTLFNLQLRHVAINFATWRASNMGAGDCGSADDQSWWV